MKIGFVSVDWSTMAGPDGKPTPGGAGYYRCGLPARGLAEHGGHDTVYACQIDQAKDGSLVLIDWDKNTYADRDIIVIQRWMDYYAPDCIKMARAAGQIIVNDVDDYFDGLDPSNLAWRQSHPTYSPFTNRDHYRKALANSTALTVSTSFLADKLRRLNVPVFVVPNAIDLDRWHPQDVSGDPVVGWVGATGFRSRDLELLKGVLGPFCVRHGVRFDHCGHAEGLTPAAEVLGFGDAVEHSSSLMVNILDYPKLFERFNIGIVPLSSAPFNQAKSAIKGLEYAASGVPFVTSSSPEYDRLYYQHQIGLLARRPKDWTRHLTHLLDRDERVELGRLGRERVAAFDLATQWKNWEKAYAELS